MTPPWRSIAGIFVLALAFYVLTGPGRIDIIDGQRRFDVAWNLVHHGTFRVTDPQLPEAPRGLDGRYAPYGPLASLVGAPWVALASALGGGAGAQMFAFSHAQAVFGAACLALLFGAWRAEGLGEAESRLSTLLVGVATPWWWYSTTTFDQALHGFLLLVSLLMGRRAAARDDARWAFGAGLVYALILQAQETFILLLPFALPFVWRFGESPSAWLRSRRFWAFVTAASAGMLGVFAYGILRFGDPLETGKSALDQPWIGRPWYGLAGLLLSPGKSIFLYHPLVLACALGLWLRARGRLTSQAVACYAAGHVALISSLAFWAGDWAWGPRYLAYLLPVVALGLPWGLRALGRAARVGIVTVALGVQLLSVSMDHQGWYFRHNLSPQFWTRQAAYWTSSPLAERPAELVEMLSGYPERPVAFAPGPWPTVPTYCTFGFAGPETGSERMRRYAIFYLPRPWPLWMARIPASITPIDPRPVLVLSFGMALLGVGLLYGRRELHDAG